MIEYVMMVSLPLSDYCPIPIPMDYLKSNYTYWKSLTPDSPSNSASEEEVSVVVNNCIGTLILCVWVYERILGYIIAWVATCTWLVHYDPVG